MALRAVFDRLKELRGRFVQAIRLTDPDYIVFKDYRSPAPGSQPKAVVPQAPEDLYFMTRYYDRDTRRMPIPRKVLTPQKPEDNTDSFAVQSATARVHGNMRFPPEMRNLGVGQHQPMSWWLFQGDAIVDKYQKLDVPPPFGKHNNWTKNPNAHQRPIYPDEFHIFSKP
eukprot:TRINITY_DN6587_c0_g1_i1.p2 TRINITY_DN6587_c0_g1~~TRINITY_DN6587_c0_g1_i1.p2  ORF type:complete len:190 (+),score=74.04 TRINITY_DN6587_c0_g1_i1:66-572(+)